MAPVLLTLTMDNDHYTTLGIDPDATPEAIKAAFRLKAKDLHPDRPGGDGPAFRQVFEAYEALRYPARRRAYDAGVVTEAVAFGLDPEPSEAGAVYDALVAWREIQTRPSFDKWMTIGEALLKGREWAKEFTGAHGAHGTAYQRAFRLWLLGNNFEAWADKSFGRTRAHLLSIMERRGEVEAWLSELPVNERVKLTHPTTIWRRFKGVRGPKNLRGVPPTFAALEAELERRDLYIAELEAQVEDLKARIEELGTVR